MADLIRGKRIKAEAKGMDDFDRPLVNLPDGREIGQILLRDGTARDRRPGNRNDWCQ
ncbi:hypothetical protein [Neorhizobium tomejilense]|uniref:hypothetical protein n=1 Tax=Neorhizobium tomejilense TaxID=2093828 RepID=UPI003ECF2311